MTLKENTLEIFITDTHFPLIDKQFYNLALKVTNDLKPEILWFNGDICDFTQVASFLVNVKELPKLQEQVTSTINGLTAFRKMAPDAAMHFKEGNHEERMYKYLTKHAPAAAALRCTEVSQLLKLDQLRCQYHPNSEKNKIGHLYHLHGNEISTGSQNPARVMLNRTNENVVFGHVHKFSMAQSRDLKRENRLCVSVGCGQDIDSVKFDFNPQWCNGLAIIQYSKKGFFHIDPIPMFKRGKKAYCLVFGKLYEA